MGYQLGWVSQIWDSEIIPEMRRRVIEARTFHTTLGTGAHPNSYVIYTSGNKTDVAVDWTLADTATAIQDGTGDGTVPSISGGCFDLSGVTTRTVFSGSDATLKHADVFKNGGIRSKGREYINQILTP